MFFLRPDILDGHHRQVVALLGIADELADSVGHEGNELSGLLLSVRQCLHGHVVDTRHLELLLDSVHRLGEAVGEEENGGSGEYLCLLQGVLPLGPEAHGDVRITR